MKNKIYKKIKKWKARLGEDIFCIVEPNPFLAQMMMFLYGIVGVMLVCDICKRYLFLTIKKLPIYHLAY